MTREENDRALVAALRALRPTCSADPCFAGFTDAAWAFDDDDQTAAFDAALRATAQRGVS